MSSVRKVTGRPSAASITLLVERVLLGQARKAGRDHELQFGAEQADRLRADFGDVLAIDQQSGVHVQVDPTPSRVMAGTSRNL